jgi:hypothetical protein
MEDNWEARVIFSPGKIAANIYLSRRMRGAGGVREFLVGNDTIKTVTPDKQLRDNELIFATLDDDQLHALQIAIANYGVKLPDAGFVQGKLEATEKHLEDTRTLLSLNTPRLMPPIQAKKEIK